ncbi:MAG: hypothetical protein RLZZ43_621, partial [Actinomycetota bacterium]
MHIRKFVTTCEDVLAEHGVPTGRVVRKAVSSAVITNPFAAKAQRERALAALGVRADEVTAYGKAAIVGLDGEIEHAAALIHPRFGAPVRKVVIKGDDIIPSTKKVAAAGSSITIPITNKDDIWSFDEMDAIEVKIDDAP